MCFKLSLQGNQVTQIARLWSTLLVSHLIFSIEDHPKWKTFEWLQSIVIAFCAMYSIRGATKVAEVLEKKSGGRHPHGHWCALHVVDTPPPQISPMITQGVQMSPGIRWNRILGVSWSERDLFFSRNYCTGLDQKIWNELRKEKKWVNWTKKLCGDKTVQQNPALVGKSLVPWLQGFNGVHVIDLRCLAAERRSLSGNFGELDPYVVLIYSIKVSHAKTAVSSIPILVGKVQGFLFLGLYKSHW